MGIETTSYTLPGIINKNPGCIFLIISKTNRSVVKEDKYKYRNILHTIVKEFHLQNNAEHNNYDISFSEKTEHLKLTDIYLFTYEDAK